MLACILRPAAGSRKRSASISELSSDQPGEWPHQCSAESIESVESAESVESLEFVHGRFRGHNGSLRAEPPARELQRGTAAARLPGASGSSSFAIWDLGRHEPEQSHDGRQIATTNYAATPGAAYGVSTICSRQRWSVPSDLWGKPVSERPFDLLSE